MKLEISNPSDEAFIESDDWEAACLSVNLISNGAYGLHGEKEMPIMIFGGADDWWRKEFGVDRENSLKRVGTERIRKALENWFLAGERTSMNDFVGIAHKLAKQLKAKP